MATSTPLEPTLATQPGVLTSRPRLPRWAPYATLGFAAILSGAILALSGALSATALVALSVVIYAVAITVWSLRVEGSRYAADRTATTVVTVAFGLALIPLVSLLWTVIDNGARVVTFTFLNTNMVGVYGEMTAGGIFHAIWGTILVTSPPPSSPSPSEFSLPFIWSSTGVGRLPEASRFSWMS